MQDLVTDFAKNQIKVMFEQLTLAEVDMKVLLITPLSEQSIVFLSNYHCVLSDFFLPFGFLSFYVMV